MVHLASSRIPAGTSEATAPWNSEDTRIAFNCDCGRVGYEELPGSEDYVGDLDQSLPGAGITPNNKWVCSASCWSQAMFLSLDLVHGASLNLIAVALTVIREELDEPTRDFLSAWLGVSAARAADVLVVSANSLQDEISRESEPSWLNRLTRAEELDRAVADAALALKCPKAHIDALAGVENLAALGADALRREMQTVSGYLAAVAERLEKALQG